MIGDDDFDSFFDADEFGCIVTLIEPGREARPVNGMWGVPAAMGRMQRANGVRAAAQIRATPDSRVLQLPNADAPVDYQLAKVVDEEGVEHSITEIVAHGRLRKLLTLVPYGSRQARAEDVKQNGWLPTKPRG